MSFLGLKPADLSMFKVSSLPHSFTAASEALMPIDNEHPSVSSLASRNVSTILVLFSWREAYRIKQEGDADAGGDGRDLQALDVPPNEPSQLLVDSTIWWPSGYALFEYISPKNKRAYYYLYGEINFLGIGTHLPQTTPEHPPFFSRKGSTLVTRFKSPNEFIPHALWLQQGQLIDHSTNCTCKYAESRTKGGPGVSTLPKQSSTVSEKQSKPYAVIRSIPLKSDRTAYSAPGNVPDSGRVEWLREGEVVWCIIHPITSTHGEAINFWPGVVENMQVISQHDTLDEDQTNRVFEGPLSARHHDDHVQSPTTSTATARYIVKLLGVRQRFAFPAGKIIPYISRRTDVDLLQVMQEVPVEHLTLDPDMAASFQPCDLSLGPVDDDSMQHRFTQAVVPYSLALEIAKSVSCCWAPMDERRPADHSPASPPRSTTLPTAFAHTAYTRDQSSHSLPSDATPFADTATQLVPERIDGQPRYQGLWWGSEQIMVNDLIRLKASRRQISSDNVFAPSGPSAGSISRWREAKNGENFEELGAVRRGVFMVLTRLFAVDVTDEGGRKNKECRASGSLYELADEEWEEGEKVTMDAVSSGGTETKRTTVHGDDRQVTGATFAMHSEQPSLPPPPAGCRFRPILRAGYEAIVSLNLLSGRYYPSLLSHPCFEVQGYNIQRVSHGVVQPEMRELLSLGGLFPGHFNPMDPVKWLPDRRAMYQVAEDENRVLLWELWSTKAADSQEVKTESST
ncbi:uncharacterized protein STEHIDRAFT_160246 [Stereum hirsutum FP-91666 SS1]|uniref:uncharacterized protein n=1 Tax=Stereum hirsutum (strain FP-91666) TaxID=721885 RepID=UPI00044496BC|nr:uncharacterized protein STEHIDRAFT_160246 [Stereum hirsutum FP-91666 SS1]EIM83676.1 hypothetical protein STEHIDRAFT_160246 [Stereum hirsutum FP-91666 SS1]